ncbi:transposase [Pantoea sp. B65]|uniref:transposase n=1 Tax=Pantoea sp. B65 TaxID=2813359 RepID=UPI0039B62C2F
MKKRLSPRLKYFCYARPGAYFVTLVTHQRKTLFGEIIDEEMFPTRLAKLATEHWFTLPRRIATLALDQMVIMPNHLHGIIWLTPENARSLTQIVCHYKAGVTREYQAHQPLWQRGFYDRVIRNEAELNAIRQYIHDNPQRWHEDRLNRSETG